MVTAPFSFVGELNDFLPRERRYREFAAPCARAATGKHMIEALDVPHTEVGRLLVNGDVLERLPEAVRLAHDAFTACDACGRVFWKGSHHKRMQAMLADAIGLESRA